jgi:hypothetical protein
MIKKEKAIAETKERQHKEKEATAKSSVDLHMRALEVGEANAKSRLLEAKAKARLMDVDAKSRIVVAGQGHGRGDRIMHAHRLGQHL